MEEGGDKPKKRRISLRKRRAARPAPGSSPGQIIAVPESPAPVLNLLAFSKESCEEQFLESVDALRKLPVQTEGVRWLNVDGLGDAETIRALGEHFQLHPLALEDVVSTQNQRPKLEEYDESVFIIARMPIQQNGHCHSAVSEQISFFLVEGGLITFQEVPGGDPFGRVRERIRKAKGKIRSRGPDYLLYALLDAIIDSYFPLLEERGDEIEDIEQDILSGMDGDSLTKLHLSKQELILIRRALWPLREVVNSLIRDTSERVSDETKIFLRDCYDHCSQLLEVTDTYRELCSDLMDIYLSKVSNRTNDVMKFLTIISTIFIPLTFIVGVYGMNFDPQTSPLNMPELRWYYGYPTVLGLMLVLSVLLLVFFRRKQWL